MHGGTPKDGGGAQYVSGTPMPTVGTHGCVGQKSMNGSTPKPGAPPHVTPAPHVTPTTATSPHHPPRDPTCGAMGAL